MTWYHGTSKDKYHEILFSWFEPNEGMWGIGIYFSSSKEGASFFGDHFLRVSIPEELISFIEFEEWVLNHPDEQTWPEEIKKLNHKATAIRYASGEMELCVFEPDVIGQIFY
jgi:hypothetical protein